MRGACIDIGSNTTRLLVADVAGRALEEVVQQRAFTHVRRGLLADQALTAAKVEELVAVVAEQLSAARAAGAGRVTVVATAAVRRASNSAALAEALQAHCGVELRVLSELEEAQLAFAGACGAAAAAGAGGARAGAGGEAELGVADVGGGSSELVVGSMPDRLHWWHSLPLGSGDLADACFHADPPSEAELGRARARVSAALSNIEVPRPARAVAVGGSAASLRRLAGDRLDAAAFAAALELLLSGPAARVAERFELDEERVRLLPAGLVILEQAQAAFGVPLDLVGGGLREGAILEMARA